MLNNMKFQSIRILTLDEFLMEMMELRATKKKNQLSPRKQQWINIINAQKLECPVTKKKVAYCSLDVNESGGTLHYNFYAEDGDFFTVDHIIPKSKGGSHMHIDNLQPMIGVYNWEKADKIL